MRVHLLRQNKPGSAAAKRLKLHTHAKKEASKGRPDTQPSYLAYDIFILWVSSDIKCDTSFGPDEVKNKLAKLM